MGTGGLSGGIQRTGRKRSMKRSSSRRIAKKRRPGLPDFVD